MTLIYTQQKSKKRKPNAKQRELQAQWDALLDKHKPKKKVEPVMTKYVTPRVPEGRSTRAYKSLDTGVGIAALPEQKVYTGDKMIGIATLHKSNAVPVFSDKEAKEVSAMRR